MIARVFATVVALAILLYLLYLVRGVLGLIAVSIFVALALGPVVEFLARRRVPRGLAILLVYLSMAGAIFGVGLLVVPSVVSGVQSISRDAPDYIVKVRKNRTFRKYDNQYKITQSIEQGAAQPQRLTASAGALRDVTVGIFGALVQLITVLTITFFLLYDGRRLAHWCMKALIPLRFERIEPLADGIYRSVVGYVAGNLAISVIAGLVSLITLLILGVPFAVPLAVLMAFFDLIPLVGATIGALVVGVVTLFSDFPTATIVWAIVQLVYQQVESSLLVPMVYRRTVNVNGLVTIVAVLIGAQLLGILGAMVAIPVAGALQIIAQELWNPPPPGVEPDPPGTAAEALTP